MLYICVDAGLVVLSNSAVLWLCWYWQDVNSKLLCIDAGLVVLSNSAVLWLCWYWQDVNSSLLCIVFMFDVYMVYTSNQLSCVIFMLMPTDAGWQDHTKRHHNDIHLLCFLRYVQCPWEQISGEYCQGKKRVYCLLQLLPPVLCIQTLSLWLLPFPTCSTIWGLKTLKLYVDNP